MTPSTPFAAELQPLVVHAGLAPSSHNTQPWRFEVRAGRVDLFADRTRSLPVNDPHDRELTISCGAALFNLRVAAAEAGMRAEVRLLPDAHARDRLATVALARGGSHDELARLFPAIEKRRTYREAFEPQLVAPETLAAMAAAADREGAWLQVLDGEPARREAAALVVQGDAAQWADGRWRRELATWMHPRRKGAGLTVPGPAVPITRLVVRSFDLGGKVGSRDAALTSRAPVLAVLGTSGDEPIDWLRAGQALQGALLEGCHRGVQASYQNQPIQIAALRPRLAALTGREGSPQLLICLGHPRRELTASPRRALSEMVELA